MSFYETIPFSYEQFVWGKIIQEGKDISGYKIVAQSSGLSERDCAEVLSKTGAGVSQAILSGQRAFALFNFLTGRVVFSCTQHSRKPENSSRFYLQTHFLICEWEALERIYFDFVFLAEQIGEIPTFEEEKTSQMVETLYEREKAIESDLLRIIERYPENFIINSYRAFKGENPVATFDSSKDETKILEYFQLLISLTPPWERQQLTFASMTSGAEPSRYKFKINPTGILKLPHIVIRLDDAKVVPESLVSVIPTYGRSQFRENLNELRHKRVAMGISLS